MLFLSPVSLLPEEEEEEDRTRREEEEKRIERECEWEWEGNVNRSVVGMEIGAKIIIARGKPAMPQEAGKRLFFFFGCYTKGKERQAANEPKGTKARWGGGPHEDQDGDGGSHLEWEWS